MPKPTELPRFAELDQLSPLSTNNVIEPPESYKKYGHSFREKYKRNFFNWIHRLTYEWLLWLDSSFIEGSVPVKMYDTVKDFTTVVPGGVVTLVGGELHFNLKWKRIDNIVNIYFENGVQVGIYGNMDGAVSTSGLRIEPRSPATWPDAFIKTQWDFLPVLSICDDLIIPGQLQISPLVADATNAMLLSCSQPNTQGDDNHVVSGQFGFTASKDNGFKQGLWSFRVT